MSPHSTKPRTTLHSLLTAFAMAISMMLSYASLADTAAQADAPDGALLTTGPHFRPAEEFKSEDWGPAHWLKDSSGYTTLEAAGRPKDPQAPKDAKPIKEIVRYWAGTAEREVIVPAESLIPPGQSKPLEDPRLRAGLTTPASCCIFTNTKRVWRKDTRGDYWVFDRDTRTLKQAGRRRRAVDADVRHVFAGRPPGGLRLPKQPLRPGPRRSAHHATHHRRFGHMINGTSDWVYEEEFGSAQRISLEPQRKIHRLLAVRHVRRSRVPAHQQHRRSLSRNHLLHLPEGRRNQFRLPRRGRHGQRRTTPGGSTRTPTRGTTTSREWNGRRTPGTWCCSNSTACRTPTRSSAATPKPERTEVLFTDRDDAWVDVVEQVALDRGRGNAFSG